MSAVGVITLAFFFVFLGIAFFLDKYFSKDEVDPDVAEVHRQLPGCSAVPSVRSLPTSGVHSMHCIVTPSVSSVSTLE